jgi:hypothetical protein
MLLETTISGLKMPGQFLQYVEKQHADEVITESFDFELHFLKVINETFTPTMSPGAARSSYD